MFMLLNYERPCVAESTQNCSQLDLWSSFIRVVCNLVGSERERWTYREEIGRNGEAERIWKWVSTAPL